MHIDLVGFLFLRLYWYLLKDLFEVFTHIVQGCLTHKWRNPESYVNSSPPGAAFMHQ